MKIRTVKKVIKEFMIKGRWTPLAKKVTFKNVMSIIDKKTIKANKALVLTEYFTYFCIVL